MKMIRSIQTRQFLTASEPSIKFRCCKPCAMTVSTKKMTLSQEIATVLILAVLQMILVVFAP
jgi:hypothetical protein